MEANGAGDRSGKREIYTCGIEVKRKRRSPKGRTCRGGVSGIINVILNQGTLARHELAEAPEAQDGDSAACRPPANPNIDGIPWMGQLWRWVAPRCFFSYPSGPMSIFGGRVDSQRPGQHSKPSKRRSNPRRAPSSREAICKRCRCGLRDVDIPAGDDRVLAALVPRHSQPKPSKRNLDLHRVSLAVVASNGPCLV